MCALKYLRILLLTWLVLIGFACNQLSHSHETDPHQVSMEEDHSHGEAAHLNERQFQALGIKVDSLHKRAMKGVVETNGQLILPPQSQAAVTAVIGANIQSVEVIEGYKVKKGQPLAYLFHPGLIELQTAYLSGVNELEYLELAYQRQEKLYAESVSAGKDFQKVKADYLSKKGLVNGLQAQLKQLGINASKIQEGHIYEKVALKAPIAGHIQSVNVRTGQYVSPQDVLFEIVQTDHIHAHFKVFESDIHKVKEGQVVQFLVESQPEVQREATVFAVGKVFESGTKAVNLHAELDNDDGSLLPGMYVRGRIVVQDDLLYALPKDAVVMENGRYFVFRAAFNQDEQEWHFKPLEVSVGLKDDDWREIKFHQEVDPNIKLAWNNAYYLLAEMKKGETEHHH